MRIEGFGDAQRVVQRGDGLVRAGKRVLTASPRIGRTASA